MISSLRQFGIASSVMLPKPHDCWRLVPEQPTGQIAGLPSFRGSAIATNGIHVVIERGQDYVIGHLDWFMADDITKTATLRAPVSAKATKVILTDLDELFL